MENKHCLTHLIWHWTLNTWRNRMYLTGPRKPFTFIIKVLSVSQGIWPSKWPSVGNPLVWPCRRGLGSTVTYSLGLSTTWPVDPMLSTDLENSPLMGMNSELRNLWFNYVQIQLHIIMQHSSSIVQSVHGPRRLY